MEYQIPSRTQKPSQKRTYRNPLIVAIELAEEMKQKGLTQTDLARKHGISRARVNQWMSLFKLSDREKRRVIAMGDNWERQMSTERLLREKLSN